MTFDSFTQPWFAATEENFRALLESAPDAILVVDQAGAIILANSQVKQVFGYEPGELLGEKVDMLIPQRFHSAHDRHRADYGESPRTRPMAKGMELLARRKDGAEFPAEIALSPMKTDRGMMVTCIVRDVTDQKTAEDARVELVREQARREQAEQATRRYHNLVQTLDAIVWEFDIATGQFTFASQRAEELLGYALEEWTRPGNFLIQHAEAQDRERVRMFFDSMRRRKAGELEFRMVAADGAVLWFRTIAQLGQDATGKSQVRGLMVDTTARRMAEQALRNSEKLAATGRLAATIAHEINNPMAAVTNVLYLLAGHPTLDETARQYTKMAQDELGRVAQITRQMLRFYRDTSNRSPLNIPELLDSTIQLFSRKIQDKRITLEKRYRECPGIFGFPGELRQVFSNLLMNALDATPTGGRIRVQASHGRIWKHRGSEGVRVTICDNGSGIKPADRAHIFEPFFTTKEQHGTGLGLWVSYGIVQKHQGDIRVRTSARAGRSGTCFSVFLPTDPEEFQARGAAD
jgi:PAS domain S-box-containing protein